MHLKKTFTKRRPFCSWRYEFTVQDLKNNAWVTVNNNFVTSEAIRQWSAMVIAESPNEWQKYRYYRLRIYIFYFLHAVLCPERIIPQKTIIDRWFRHCR